MTIKPYSHSVTPLEINAIKLLAYQIEGLQNREEDFINSNFPNCDLFRLLTEINDLLKPYCQSSIERVIKLNDIVPPSIEIFYLTDDFDDEDKGLVIARTFTWENSELIVKHDFFRLPRIYRGKGIAKRVFKSFLQQYVNMDVKKIRVHAALEDGGYVWAKNFFTADSKAEITDILNDAKQKLSPQEFIAIQRIYENYYTKNPTGKAFPIQKWAELPFMETILRGSHWNGSIDLKNKEQFTNFVKYVLGEI